MTDYERLREVANEIYNRAVEDHQIVWRGDEVFETFDKTPLGEATRTFNEACVLLAQFSADAGAMMVHTHNFADDRLRRELGKADRCTVCGYDRRPSS